MSVADLMAAMAAAGAPMDAIILAVRALEEKDAQIEARRAGDRERKRRQRAQQRDEDGTVTGQSRDTTVTVTDAGPAPSPPNENILTPHTLTPGKDKPTRAKPAHRMPEDWQPQPVEGEVGAAVSRWPPGSIERELGRFRDWALSASGPNAKKSDWQAAWRNWLRTADDEGRYRNGQRNGSSQRLGGNGGGGSLSGHGRTVDGMQLALQRATAGGAH